MLERKNSFIPVPDASSERFTLAIPFPRYINQQNIGVDVREIERLCDLGGIKHITIRGDTWKASNDVVITGFDAQGNAYGGKAKEKEVTLFKSYHTQKDNNKPFSARWCKGEIIINIDEVMGRLQTGDIWKDNARSTSGWSYYIDKSIRKGLTEIGQQQLVSSINSKDYFDICMILGASAGVGGVTISSHTTLPSFALITGSIFLAFNAFASAYSQSLYPTEKHHFSTLYAPQLDRALLLRGRTSTTTVVKDLSP